MGHNFPKTILGLAAGQPDLAINDDQTGAPTSAEFLAAATAAVVRDHLSGLAPPVGLYNLTSSGQTTWLGYARYLLTKASEFGFPLMAGPSALRPRLGPEPGRPVTRPLN
jgi:dTDP-4-dehydrorhamnose reductase